MLSSRLPALVAALTLASVAVPAAAYEFKGPAPGKKDFIRALRDSRIVVQSLPTKLDFKATARPQSKSMALPDGSILQHSSMLIDMPYKQARRVLNLRNWGDDLAKIHDHAIRDVKTTQRGGLGASFQEEYMELGDIPGVDRSTMIKDVVTKLGRKESFVAWRVKDSVPTATTFNQKTTWKDVGRLMVTPEGDKTRLRWVTNFGANSVVSDATKKIAPVVTGELMGLFVRRFFKASLTNQAKNMTLRANALEPR